MEESKEAKREEEAVASYDSNNMFQKPYDFIEEVVRAILRCLGFDEPPSTAYQRCSCCTVTPSESTTSAAGATSSDDGAEKEETTCPDEEVELPPPSAAPEQGGDEGVDVGGGGGEEDGGGDDLSDPTVVEPEPVLDDGSHQHPGAATEAIRRRPPRPGVSSGSDPQIH